MLHLEDLYNTCSDVIGKTFYLVGKCAHFQKIWIANLLCISMSVLLRGLWIVGRVSGQSCAAFDIVSPV